MVPKILTYSSFNHLEWILAAITIGENLVNVSVTLLSIFTALYTIISLGHIFYLVIWICTCLIYVQSFNVCTSFCACSFNFIFLLHSMFLILFSLISCIHEFRGFPFLDFYIIEINSGVHEYLKSHIQDNVHA
jgi:hypothetical protein